MAGEAGIVANAAEGSGPGTSSSGNTKLSIYPASMPEHFLLDPLCVREANWDGIIDRWISVEEKVETRIKSFRDPTEPMNPGLLYTGISALTMSVLTCSGALPTRILLPPADIVGAFAYFLPGTASRVGAYADELEGRYIPRIGEIRRTSIAHSGIAWERAKEGAAAG
ncbi:hypothetical protein DFH29DRAFT_1009836 [Suillus ampliporus]|nr:hypothetical protein DFH29DRAFT_1009836 [Suillus ampliporus]